MFTFAEWPARRRSTEEVSGLQPVSDPKVGDLVVIHSRGSWREARVEKVGRTNVTVVYTTEGAIRDAQRWNVRTAGELRDDADRLDERDGASVSDYTARLRALAVEVEALPKARQWEAFVRETRKSVKFAETFQA